MNQHFSSIPVAKEPPLSYSNSLNQVHLQPVMTHKNGNEKAMSLLQRFRKRRRKWFKRRKKRILRALFRYLGKQSLVGDPPVFDASKFPWAMELEKNFDVIHRELQGILARKEFRPEKIGGRSFSRGSGMRLNKVGNGAQRP